MDAESVDNTHMILLLKGMESSKNNYSFHLDLISTCLKDPFALAKGELMFQKYYEKPYFLISLLQIACDEQIEFEKRQLAILVLKNTIIDTWTNSALSEQEKESILDLLLSNISMHNERIKSEVCRIIGLTVSYDFPNLHQNLIPSL
jgi:hypothetical protein